MNKQACTNLIRLLASFTVVVQSSAALAQEADEQKLRKAAARKMIREECASYRIALAAGSKQQALLHPFPVKTWTNDVNGEFYGSVFVWTLDGQPQVAGSLYRSFAPYSYFAAELQSLSERELSATKDDEAVWQPPAGAKFRLLPKSGVPSELRTTRLIQMRSLARRFEGELTDDAKVRRRLQISPQPLYRYEKTPSNLLDGALFSLVSGTDPEVLLLIEARHTESELQWQYALARLSIMELRVALDGEVVWGAELLEKPYTRMREPYTIIQRDFDDAE